MKITFVIPKLSYSGAPKMLSWIANRISLKGHDVEMVTFFIADIHQVLEKNIKFHCLNKKQSKRWIIRNTVGLFTTVKKLLKHISASQPDLVVSFLDPVSYLYIIVNKIIIINRSKILVSERVDPFIRHGWKNKIRFSVISFADYVVFQTKEARDYFGKKYAENSTIINNPVIVNNELKLVLEKIASAPIPRKRTIVSVGRLSLKQKRQDLLLEAFRIVIEKHPDFELILYGNGQDEEKIKQQITQHRMESKVILAGHQRGILSKIVDATAFVMTSDYEGIPNALIEAMSIGVPCVSTDCSPGGARLLIENGKNGFLVARGDVHEIADKINWIIENPIQALEMSKEAMKIKDKFSEEEIANQWERTITSV